MKVSSSSEVLVRSQGLNVQVAGPKRSNEHGVLGPMDSFRRVRQLFSRKPVAIPPQNLIQHKPGLEDYVRHFAGMRAYRINFPKSEALLMSFGDEPLAKIWIGILRRMKGREDPRPFLEPFLKHEKYGRLALLNLCAFYVTEYFPERETARFYLDEIKSYVEQNPKDNFAVLVEALLMRSLFDRIGAEKVLENLYLDCPSYTPAISVLASFYHSSGLREAAFDYAAEALRTRPDDVQARSIASSEHGLPLDKELHCQFNHVPRLAWGIEPEVLLFWQYDYIDPSVD